MTAYKVWLVVEVTDEKKAQSVGSDDPEDLPTDEQYIRDEMQSTQDAFDYIHMDLVEKIPE